MSPTFAERFRAANDWAFNNQYFGGWPTCYDGDGVHGIATLNREYEDYVGVSDVKRSDLGNPPLDNTNRAYRLRLTSANDYARNRGYAYGRPNFHMADWGGGVVCGTFFYRDGISEWQDVTTRDLDMAGHPEEFGNPLEEWFGRLHLYATRNGYATGIPNGHYANYDGWVIGSILFPSGTVTVHSVPVSELNYPTGGGGGTVYVTVPRVVDKRFYDATETIERAKLKPVWYSTGVTANHVCVRQQPLDGTSVKAGSSVTLTFELGGIE